MEQRRARLHVRVNHPSLISHDIICACQLQHLVNPHPPRKVFQELECKFSSCPPEKPLSLHLWTSLTVKQKTQQQADCATFWSLFFLYNSARLLSNIHSCHTSDTNKRVAAITALVIGLISPNLYRSTVHYVSALCAGAPAFKGCFWLKGTIVGPIWDKTTCK